MRYRNQLVALALFLGLVFLMPWKAIGDGASSLAKTIAVTQSGTWTVQPGNTANTTAWKVDGSAVTQPVSGTFWQATQPVSLASVPSHAVTNAGTFATQADTELPAAGALADATSNPTVPGVAGFNMCWNGSTWDRCKTSSSGNGATDSSTARVTISNDSTGTVIATQSTASNLKVQHDASGATGAAPPSRANFTGGISSGATGGLLGGITVCDNWVAINQTSGTQLISGVASRKVYICSINLVTASAQNIALVGGTGTVCATGTHAIAGGTTAATGWNLAANGGLAMGSGIGAIMQAGTAADNVCLLQSSTGQISGAISYAIY